MKKYLTIFLLIGSLYSCNTKNNTAITSANNDSTGSPATTADNTGSTESILSLADSFQSQHEGKFVLQSLAGKPTVVSMIFTHCTFACPMLTSDLKKISEKLKGNNDKVNFVLVSFDSERDSPAQLKKFQEQMDLDPKWILLQGNEQSVRTLSVLLNVQFEKDAEGNFSHSNLITVLDKNGAVKFQKEGLQADHTETVATIKALLEK